MRPRLRFTPLEDRTTPAAFTVTTLSDVTAADGQITLREAVALANATPGPDAIAFDPSLAGGTIALGGPSGTDAGLSLSDDVTLTGFPDNPVAVAGGFSDGAAPSDVILVQAGATASVSGLRVSNTTPLGHGVTNLGALTLDRVTITGVTGGSGLRNAGTATVTNCVIAGNATAALFEGGGATNLGGTLTVRDTRIENNQSTNVGVGAGGGLLEVAGRVDLSNVTVAGNTAAVGGGGIVVLAGTLTATGGRVTGNTAAVGGGIGLLGLDPPDGSSAVTNVTLSGVVVDGNTARTGGGIGVAVYNPGFAPTLVMTDCTVSNNKADPDTTATLVLGVTAETPPQTIALPRGVGGGLVVAGGTVTVTGGSFTGNTATAGGGLGVFLGTVAVTGTTVGGNAAVSGAGAALVGTSVGPTAATFTATTFADNTAAPNQTGSLSYTIPGVTTPSITRGAGGGLSVAGATVTATDTTLAGNTATTGGGLAVEGGTALVFNSTVARNSATGSAGGAAVTGGTVTVRSSIFANTAPAAPDVAGAVTSVGGNVVGVADTGTGFGPSDRTGTAASPLDPRLGPLADNGGPTRTLLPAPDSPAVGAGSATDAPATDQRGRARVAGAAIDAGAVERQADDPGTITPPLAPRAFAVGAGAGGAVRVFNADGTERATLAPFGAGFTGGVRVAVADLTGDGVEDVVAGTGPGSATRVVVIDGKSGAVAFDLMPFEAAFTGGVYVAAGDVDGDGVAELVVTPDEGGGPRVDVYRGGGFGKLASFFGIDDPNFRGGARAALGDLNGDGRADLVVAAGFGGGPRIAAYDGTTVQGGNPTRLFNDIFVFEQTLRNGVFVAAGDLDGDGRADLVAGGGPGGGPRVLALSGADLAAGRLASPGVLANAFVGDPNNRGGVRVAVKDLDGDARADLVVGDGEGSGTHVAAYRGKDFAGEDAPTDFEFDAFGGSGSGVFVG